MRTIPLAAPDLSGNEERYLLDALRSSWISSQGSYLRRFESEFAAACGTRHALAVCNGTIALHLALLGLDVRPGDEVIVPSLTYVATANACHYVGATPVFVDVDSESWCMDPIAVEEAITPRTKGIIPVHLYGHPSPMDAISRIAAVHGCWVVEDAAEAHFARYRGKTVGSFGQIATFSFYGNKIITSGEGGALTLNDDHLATRLRTLRGQGVDPERCYFFPVTGHNFRLTNLAASLLCAQLERRAQIQQRRREIVARYREALTAIPGVAIQRPAPDVDVADWLMCVLVDANASAVTRDELAEALRLLGIETRPFFLPLHTLPPFRGEHRKRGGASLPVTERVAASGLNLPTSTLMSDEEVDFVAGAVVGLVRGTSVPSPGG